MRRLVMCVACLLALTAGPACALELGAIESRSALYEPLDARIPLRGVKSGDVEALKVDLGSPAQFELAGVARMSHLGLLEFTTVAQGDGTGYIQVRTNEPIIEPSLTFLIEVDWPRGRTVRGYRLDLAAAAEDATDASTGDGTEMAGEPEAPGSVVTPISPPATSDSATYGPVLSRDTLWSIAVRFRPDKSVSVQHMMLALLEKNPEAFAFRNVNALNAGATLRIPTGDEFGPDDLATAVAEVKRQHEAWKQRGEGPPAAPAPSAAQPPARDADPEPGGRVRIVSPETPASAAGSEEGATTEALRNDLALAMEDADAGRRENDELKLRLVEAEDHIRELNRLVELKNEEIAALQAELQAMAPGEPEPGPVEPEAMPELAPVDAEAMLEPAPVDAAITPEPAPEPVPAEPEAAPAEEEPKPVLASPAEPESKPVPAPEEPKSLPFDLDALPVNPVFLVGGAGLLLIVLGAVALLRRRRASGSEDPAPDAAPAGEDNILVELEAVAAELADDTAARPDRRGRSGPVAAAHGLAVGAAGSDEPRLEPDTVTEQQIAKLWTDSPEAERRRIGEAGADDEPDDMKLDIRALSGADSDSESDGDDTSDEFDLRALADLDDVITDRDESRDGSGEEASGDLEYLFSGHDTLDDDSGAHESVPTSAVGRPADDGRGHGRLASFDDDDSPGSGSAPAGTAELDIGWEPGAAPAASVNVEPGSGDGPGGQAPAPRIPLADATDDDDIEALPLDDVGEDETQTKIDLAQVYMEMGDTDSARGFLEAVLAEGDAEQREIAREMLSRLA